MLKNIFLYSTDAGLHGFERGFKVSSKVMTPYVMYLWPPSFAKCSILCQKWSRLGFHKISRRISPVLDRELRRSVSKDPFLRVHAQKVVVLTSQICMTILDNKGRWESGWGGWIGMPMLLFLHYCPIVVQTSKCLFKSSARATWRIPGPD